MFATGIRPVETRIAAGVARGITRIMEKPNDDPIKKTLMNMRDGKAGERYKDGLARAAHITGTQVPLAGQFRSRTTKTYNKNLNPYDTTLYGTTFTKTREGHFERIPTPDCVNNQNCGLHDGGACHGCDSEEECRDLGLSSTLFVTHHRKYMQHNKKFNWETKQRDSARYHCRRVGPWGQHTCSCKCDAHTPCCSKKDYVLTNKMLHANSYDSIPTQQDCCDMCTNHPKCGSWEYSPGAGKCVLKEGAPQFLAVPAASKSAGVVVFSGARAGNSCNVAAAAAN